MTDINMIIKNIELLILKKLSDYKFELPADEYDVFAENVAIDITNFLLYINKNHLSLEEIIKKAKKEKIEL